RSQQQCDDAECHRLLTHGGAAREWLRSGVPSRRCESSEDVPPAVRTEQFDSGSRRRVQRDEYAELWTARNAQSFERCLRGDYFGKRLSERFTRVSVFGALSVRPRWTRVIDSPLDLIPPTPRTLQEEIYS